MCRCRDARVVSRGFGSCSIDKDGERDEKAFRTADGFDRRGHHGIGLVATGSNVRADEVKSGLKPGEAPAAFLVQDATGPAAGTGKLCYRCRYGGNPVVAVFTHKLDASVTSLVKKVDARGREEQGQEAQGVRRPADRRSGQGRNEAQGDRREEQHQERPADDLRRASRTAGLQAVPQGRDHRVDVGQERREGQPRLLRRKARREVDRDHRPRHGQNPRLTG